MDTLELVGDLKDYIQGTVLCGGEIELARQASPAGSRGYKRC